MQAERFEEFVRDYGERAFRFAYRLCGNIDEAKDLVQEAFRRVLERWDRLDASQPLEGWFFTVLRHLFCDGRRTFTSRNMVSLESLGEGADGEPLGEVVADREEAALETLEKRESSELVQAALGELSVELRGALLLCDVEQLSYEEISRLLDIPPGTVRSRIFRARSLLRRRLASAVELEL